MKNSTKNIKILQVIEIMVGIVWLIAMLLLIKFETASLTTWIGLFAGILAFALVGCFLFDSSRKYNENAVEVGALSLYFSGIYLGVSVLFNTLIAVISSRNTNEDILSVMLRATVIINMLLLLVYVIASIGANSYNSRVSESMQSAVIRKSMYSEIRNKVAVLKDLLKNENSKKEIQKLYELVAYSSNVTKDSAIEIENQVMKSLDEIETVITAEGDSESVAIMIQNVIRLWNQRNRY